jgi:hypothetical protein
MSSQKSFLHFQHTWISVTWCEDLGLMKTIYVQLKMHSIGFTSIEVYFENTEWSKIFHYPVSILWFTMLKALPCSGHRTGCVHQLPRHVTFLPSKSHGEGPAVSMHSLRFSLQTNALRNSLLADKILLTGECFLGTHMQRFAGN